FAVIADGLDDIAVRVVHHDAAADCVAGGGRPDLDVVEIEACLEEGKRLEPNPISIGRLNSGPAVKRVMATFVSATPGMAAIEVSSKWVTAAAGISCHSPKPQLPLSRASVSRRLVVKSVSSLRSVVPSEVSPKAARPPRTRFGDRR